MATRLYTEAEARALLPQVIPVVQAIQRAFRGLRALQATVAAESRGASGDGNLVADPWAEGGQDGAEAMSLELRENVARLSRWEIEIKDPDRGLIDFQSERDGQVVYLCYLLGEPDLAYWHTVDGGFAGRKPL